MFIASAPDLLSDYYFRLCTRLSLFSVYQEYDVFLIYAS